MNNIESSIYPLFVQKIRSNYESVRIHNAEEFEEVLNHVLSDSER